MLKTECFDAERDFGLKSKPTFIPYSLCFNLVCRTCHDRRTIHLFVPSAAHLRKVLFSSTLDRRLHEDWLTKNRMNRLVDDVLHTRLGT